MNSEAFFKSAAGGDGVDEDSFLDLQKRIVSFRPPLIPSSEARSSGGIWEDDFEGGFNSYKSRFLIAVCGYVCGHGAKLHPLAEVSQLPHLRHFLNVEK